MSFVCFIAYSSESLVLGLHGGINTFATKYVELIGWCKRCYGSDSYRSLPVQLLSLLLFPEGSWNSSTFCLWLTHISIDCIFHVQYAGQLTLPKFIWDVNRALIVAVSDEKTHIIRNPNKVNGANRRPARTISDFKYDGVKTTTSRIFEVKFLH